MDHRVWIVIDPMSILAMVTLNGERLGGTETNVVYRFDITALLRLTNELTIEIDGGSPDASRDAPPAEVVLEIVETSPST